MMQIRKVILVALGCVASLIALSLIPVRPVAATPGGPTVTVVNTAAEAVPVSLQGTGVISGTVNANITNPSVPVSISGTPNVNVANSPTVSLATGTSVRDADNPARQFYTAETGAALTLAGGLATFNPVPSGKVLVVEHVSLRVDDIIPSGARYLPRFLVPDSANTSTDDQFPLTLVLQDTDFWVASETVRFYFPAGTSPALVVEPGSGSPTSGIADVSISGYLVNIP